MREALAGSRRDLTAMPLGRAVLLIAIPMILEMIAESIFAIVDIFWVSKLGANAIAAVGLTESLLTVVYAGAMGLSIGVGAVVARRTGAKDAAGASRAAVQAVVIGVGLSLVVGTAGAIAGPRLLAMMGASPAVQAIGAGYTRTIFAGSVSVILLFMVNAAFRGAGDAALTMRTLWLANGINIVLGPVFIFGLGPAPRLGVTGAAVATTIGRGIGVLYQLHNLRAGRGRLSVPRSELRIDLETLRTILRIARSAVVQMLIGMTSWVGLVRILSTFGSAALAGYTVAVRVVLFALLPSWGLGNAAATLVGQNLGAGNPARAEQAVWRAAFYNFVFLGALGLLLFVCGHGILSLFTSEPEVVTARRPLPAHRRARIPALRLRHGRLAGIQRRRRHAHADLDQLRLLLVVRDPGRVPALAGAGYRADRRLRLDHPRVLHDGAGLGDHLPSRALEAREGLNGFPAAERRRNVTHCCAGSATISTFRHISLRVPQPGSTAWVSFDVLYSQVTEICVSGVIAMGALYE